MMVMTTSCRYRDKDDDDLSMRKHYYLFPFYGPPIPVLLRQQGGQRIVVNDW